MTVDVVRFNCYKRTASGLTFAASVYIFAVAATVHGNRVATVLTAKSSHW